MAHQGWVFNLSAQKKRRPQKQDDFVSVSSKSLQNVRLKAGYNSWGYPFWTGQSHNEIIHLVSAYKCTCSSHVRVNDHALYSIGFGKCPTA